MHSIDDVPRMMRALAAAVALIAAPLAVALADGDDEVFVPRLVNTSTIPANGDINPYGVAFVPSGFPPGGAIHPGDVLIANWNNTGNVQGTGTTVVQFTPTGPLAPPGAAQVFFTSSLPGTDTALGVLRGGYVLVGTVPTTDGTAATIGQGALQVVDRNGHWLATWTDPVFLDGPWDLTIVDEGTHAHVFVSNVLNGTVSRLDVAVGSSGVTLQSKTTIAKGYTTMPNPAAVIIGPTGLAYDAGSDTLYVASTADNAIFSVPHAIARGSAAWRGSLVFADTHLRGPLALRFAPNGHLLTANGDAVNGDVLHPSEIVEFTRSGRFVREYDVDASQGGAFGLDTVLGREARFNYAAVDDVTNSLAVTRLPPD